MDYPTFNDALRDAVEAPGLGYREFGRILREFSVEKGLNPTRGLSGTSINRLSKGEAPEPSNELRSLIAATLEDRLGHSDQSILAAIRGAPYRTTPVSSDTRPRIEHFVEKVEHHSTIWGFYPPRGPAAQVEARGLGLLTYLALDKACRIKICFRPMTRAECRFPDRPWLPALRTLRRLACVIHRDMARREAEDFDGYRHGVQREELNRRMEDLQDIAPQHGESGAPCDKSGEAIASWIARQFDIFCYVIGETDFPGPLCPDNTIQFMAEPPVTSPTSERLAIIVVGGADPLSIPASPLHDYVQDLDMAAPDGWQTVEPHDLLATQ